MAYPSEAIEAQGTTINIRNQGDTAWLEIGEITSFDGPGGSASVIPVTHLKSLRVEKRMGLADEGQCTFTLMFRPANAAHAELVAAKADRQIRDFRVVMTDTPATEYRFSGYVLSVPISASVDAVVESSVTIEISGAVAEL